MKIAELLRFGIEKLKNNNIAEPILKSRMLLAFLLNMSKEKLVLQYEKEIDVKSEINFLSKIEELINGKPLQYITNKQEFMKLDFYVDENVLIPRADTEILVEEVIKYAKVNMSILDLCTGSGAIAVSLAKYTKASIFASDISIKAIEIAKKNSNMNNTNVKFIVSDMFDNINEKFDIIVSNPPYIETDTIDSLSLNVKNEPRNALDGGNDGLKYYKIIAKQGKDFLNRDGILCLEIGYNQKDSVTKLLSDNDFKNIKCVKDLNMNDRVIICSK